MGNTAPVTTSQSHLPPSRRTGFSGFMHKLNQQRALVWMSIPFFNLVVYFQIFAYLGLDDCFSGF